MNVVTNKELNHPYIFQFGRRGEIKDMQIETNQRDICVEWNRFGLKQMCSMDQEWDHDIKFLNCPVNFN